MKTNTAKNRYELASIAVLQKLPRWKQKAIQDDIKTKNDSRVMEEYASAVAQLAESNQEIFTTTE